MISEMNERTDEQTETDRVCHGRRLTYGETNHDASQKFTEGWSKIPRSSNKYTKFGLLIIGKIRPIKILPPEVTFKDKMHKIRFPASVRSFVRPSVRQFVS